MNHQTIGQRGTQLARVSTRFLMAEYVMEWMLLLSSAFSVSVVPFLRHNFGERYLSLMNIYCGVLAVGSFLPLGGMFDYFSTQHRTLSMALMFLAYVAFLFTSAVHRMVIDQRNRDGIECHSFYMGDSVFNDIAEFRGMFTTEAIHKWIEPGLVALAGVIGLKLLPPIGLWLCISGVALFVNNQIIYFRQRVQFLDLRDARIEARYLSDALAGKPANVTAGLVFAESNIQLLRKDVGLKAAFDSLGEEMKAMLNPAKAA